MEPAGDAVGAVGLSMMKTPGNSISEIFSFITALPPMMSTQKCFWASTSLVYRCTCPMVTPVVLGAASSASAGIAQKTERAMEIASMLRSFIGQYFITYDAARPPCSWFDVGQAPGLR